jgi:hypothetical protein
MVTMLTLWTAMLPLPDILGAREERVRALVKQLGDARYREREKAQEALLRQGPSVLPILEKLGATRDPEINDRLAKIRRALTPADEPDVVTAQGSVFWMPVNVPEYQLSTSKDLRLLVSKNRGLTWVVAQTMPAAENAKFKFTAPAEGLYYFDLQIVRTDGSLDPQTPSPLMKVRIQTKQR